MAELCRRVTTQGRSQSFNEKFYSEVRQRRAEPGCWRWRLRKQGHLDVIV